MFDLSLSGWLLAIVCGTVAGMSKCGIPGLGALAAPLLASVLPAKAATGALLPLLISGDCVGATYFRRSANWRLLFKLLPMAVLGIWIGYLLLGCSWMDDLAIRYITAVIVLVLLILGFFRGTLDRLVTGGEGGRNRFALWSMAIFFGVLSGVTTMLANAAGPVALIYLLAMRLPKDEFIGTNAWFFLAMNWIKVPFMVGRGMIGGESLLFNLKLLPAVFAGCLLGALLSRRLSDRKFRLSIQILTAIAAALLFLPPGTLTEFFRNLLQTP